MSGYPILIRAYISSPDSPPLTSRVVVFETDRETHTRPCPASVGSTQQRSPRRPLPPRPLPQLSPTSLAPPFQSRSLLQERRPQAEPRVEPPSSSPHGRAVKKPRVSPRLPGSGLGASPPLDSSPQWAPQWVDSVGSARVCAVRASRALVRPLASDRDAYGCRFFLKRR